MKSIDFEEIKNYSKKSAYILIDEQHVNTDEVSHGEISSLPKMQQTHLHRPALRSASRVYEDMEIDCWK